MNNSDLYRLRISLPNLNFKDILASNSKRDIFYEVRFQGSLGLTPLKISSTKLDFKDI